MRSTLAGFSGQPPVNFLLHSFVDQLKILETVADLFITHGGQNSLMEALYFKTPCIVIPFFGYARVAPILPSPTQSDARRRALGGARHSIVPTILL